MKPSTDCHRELCLLMNRRIVAQLSAKKSVSGLPVWQKYRKRQKVGADSNMVNGK